MLRKVIKPLIHSLPEHSKRRDCPYIKRTMKNHNIRSIYLFLLLALYPGMLSHAQDATPSMADLRSIAGKVKALNSYSYETVTNAVFANGKKDQMTTTVYMDRARKRLSYKTNTEVVLLTEKWAYQANHKKKTVGVFDVARYNEKNKKNLQQLDAVFKSNIAATFMDSIVLHSGKLVSAKRSGDLVTFTLKFPAGLTLQEMIITYNTAKQLPQQITTRSFFAADESGNNTKGTRVETMSRNYSASVPESTFDPGQYFRVQGGKVILSQFKNYKVSSIL
jgi:outer membrane lipoprotein-sorting protein